MDLVFLVLQIALVGLIIWLITTKIPMNPEFAMLIKFIVILAVIFYVLKMFRIGIPNFF